MHARTLHTLLVAASLAGPAALAACDRGGGRAPRAEERPGAVQPRDAASGRALAATTAERGSIRIIGADTLSDSARVLTLIPEPDGEAIVFTFADSMRGVAAGLGILDRRRQTAQLLWPDSVMRAWWSGPHSLAFITATGARGVRVVIDVHAESLRTAEREPSAQPRPDSVAPPSLDAARARATAYIDSVRVQPTGEPQGSQLRYVVTRVLMAPRDSLGAFHVIARAAGGERLNPSWYAVDLRSGAVQPIDSVVGSAAALREEAGAWVDGERFVYAKGPVIHEARIGRR